CEARRGEAISLGLLRSTGLRGLSLRGPKGRSNLVGGASFDRVTRLSLRGPKGRSNLVGIVPSRQLLATTGLRSSQGQRYAGCLCEARRAEAISRKFYSISLLRSTHLGFSALIRAIFFLREPPLICFSRRMACSIPPQSS